MSNEKSYKELISDFCGEKVINVQEEFGDLVVGESYDDLANGFDSEWDLAKFDPKPLCEYLDINTFVGVEYWKNALKRHLGAENAELVISAWEIEQDND